MQPVRFFMAKKKKKKKKKIKKKRMLRLTVPEAIAPEAHSSFTCRVRAPRRGARVVVLRAVGYWLGWLGIFLSCSMTWSRL